MTEEQLAEMLAARLRDMRTERGLSQKALAELCMMHQAQISLTERGRGRLSVAQLYRIAREIGCPLDEHPLFGGASAPADASAPAFVRQLARMRRALLAMPHASRRALVALAEGVAGTTTEDDDGA